MVKAPQLMRSQRVQNPQTTSFCVCVPQFGFPLHTCAAPIHVHWLPTHIFLCVLLMAAGSRVHAVGIVVGQKAAAR